MLSEGTGQAEGHGDVAGSEGRGLRLRPSQDREGSTPTWHFRVRGDRGSVSLARPAVQAGAPRRHHGSWRAPPAARGACGPAGEKGGRAWTAGWYTPAQASAGCSR